MQKKSSCHQKIKDHAYQLQQKDKQISSLTESESILQSKLCKKKKKKKKELSYSSKKITNYKVMLLNTILTTLVIIKKPLIYL